MSNAVEAQVQNSTSPDDLANQENNGTINGGVSGNGDKNDKDQWDDVALANATTKKTSVTVAPTGAVTKDLMDMKSLDLKGNEEDQIAERLRIEETRNQLAAAREGMEREAQRIKDEKEKKDQAAANNKTAGPGGTGANRFGAASSSLGGGGKWVSSRMRDGGAGMGGGGGASRWGGVGVGGAMGTQKLDTDDQNLFPDLAAADAILEKQKQESVAYQVPKKTPVGGGATWASPQASGGGGSGGGGTGSRPKLNLKPKTQSASTEEKPAETAEPDSKPDEGAPAAKEEPPFVAGTAPAPTPGAAATPSSETSTDTPAPIKPIKKKKKKDLSTFGKK